MLILSRFGPDSWTCLRVDVCVFECVDVVNVVGGVVVSSWRSVVLRVMAWGVRP